MLRKQQISERRARKIRKAKEAAPVGGRVEIKKRRAREVVRKINKRRVK